MELTKELQNICRNMVMKLNLIEKKWWPEVESNYRHKDFQSFALPTELSGQCETGL